MSKLELKAAMESLQVKKPLKLHDRQPQFKVPPTISDPTWVAGETQVDPRTQVAMATEVPLQTRVPVATPVAAPTEVAGTTQVPVATQVGTQAPVPAPTQVPTETQVAARTPVDVATPVPVPTQVVAQTPVPAATQVIVEDGVTRSASDQDSSVTLEAQTAPKLHQGYTRLPNSILMRMAAGDLIRSEMQILLLIARFTISFQKRYAPLSKTVLERQSGLRGPAILQAISDLQAKGLIEKIPGDQHRPNQLGLVFEDEWDFFSKSKATTTSVPLQNQAQTQVAPATQVPVATPVAVGTPAPVAVPTPAGVAAATPFKDILKYKNNSLSELPAPLQKYFGELKPAKKREGEWQAFENLQGDYQAEDISECLELLQERGIKRRGPNGEESQPCHSPMAYLAKAMGEIFGEVESRRQKARERIEREQREVQAARELQENDEREAAEWAVKERAFVEAIPEEDRQHEVIAGLLENMPFRPNSQVGRRMGIGLWSDLSKPECIDRKRSNGNDQP